MRAGPCCQNCIYWKRELFDFGRSFVMRCSHKKHGDKLEIRRHVDGTYCKEFLPKGPSA
jgi:hypothetical protein